jgi:cytochrome c553
VKKILWFGLSSIIILVLILLGPALLDLYRLQNYIDQSSKTAQAEGGPWWSRLNDECTFCHGVRGNAQHQAYPRLAGQPAAYLAAQLRSFAAGARPTPQMVTLAMTLSDADIKAVSEYFAKQMPDANASFTPDPRLREEGRQLVAKLNCGACHGESMGGQGELPRLAGQGYDYLVAQLNSYAAGARRDPAGVMNALSASISLEDRQAIAQFLASYLQHRAAD